jgi:hypothetical protein
MNGVPWELSEPARQIQPVAVGGVSGSLPAQRKRARRNDQTTGTTKENKLDTISERQSVDAHASLTDLSGSGSVGKDGDTFDGAGQMKVHRLCDYCGTVETSSGPRFRLCGGCMTTQYCVRLAPLSPSLSVY